MALDRAEPGTEVRAWSALTSQAEGGNTGAGGFGVLTTVLPLLHSRCASSIVFS